MLSSWLDDPSDDPTAATWSASSASALLDDSAWYTGSDVIPAPQSATTNNNISSSSSNIAVNPFLYLSHSPPRLLTSPPPPPPHMISNDFCGFGSTSNLFNLNPLSTFETRPKILRPLETSPPVGATPTLFQKRVARQMNPARFGIEEGNKRRKAGSSVVIEDQDEMDDVGSFDGSGLNYDSDEVFPPDNGGNGGGNSNAGGE